jgi:hypothetical protein
MAFHQEVPELLEITGRQRTRRRTGALRLGYHMPHPGNQRWRQPPLDLGQICWYQLGQIAQPGAPLLTECERFLTLPPALVERAAGQPM